jgi:hypothetical protein
VLTGASFVVEVSTPRLPRDVTASEAPPAASSHQADPDPAVFIPPTRAVTVPSTSPWLCGRDGSGNAAFLLVAVYSRLAFSISTGLISTSAAREGEDRLAAGTGREPTRGDAQPAGRPRGSGRTNGIVIVGALSVGGAPVGEVREEDLTAVLGAGKWTLEIMKAA